VPAVALVQASSRSWAGGPDDSVNFVDGVPAVVHTLRVLGTALPDVPRVVIAPAFEHDGALGCLRATSSATSSCSPRTTRRRSSGWWPRR
jgi:hypothetical protein